MPTIALGRQATADLMREMLAVVAALCSLASSETIACQASSLIHTAVMLGRTDHMVVQMVKASVTVLVEVAAAAPQPAAEVAPVQVLVLVEVLGDAAAWVLAV